MRFILPLFLVFGLFVTSACQKDLTSTTYNGVQSDVTTRTFKGIVVSARQIQVKPGGSGAGTLLGGGSGALAGSAFGSGSGNTAAILGGALAGAIAGNLIEANMNEQNAMEYIVDISGSGFSKKKKKIKNNQVLDEEDTTSGLETDIRTIVQAADPNIAVGSRVYLIESNGGRPRLVPAPR